jgi:ABC-type bacteriocin/lantibiotic exporter with double-glycine peptidase domain
MVDRLGYLRSLLRFAFRKNPYLYLSLTLSVVSVVLELAAMTTLLPLASLAAGQTLPERSLPVVLIASAGLNVDARTLLLVFALLFSARVITQFAGQGLTLFLSKRMVAQLSTEAFENLVTAVPLKEVERASIGSYITLVGDEAFRASNLVVYLNQFLALALLAVLYFGAVFAYSPLVGVAVLIFLSLSFVAMFQSFRVSHKLGARQVEQSQSASSVFLDALNGLRSVRAFSAENFVSTSYRAQIWRYVRTLFAIDAISLLTRLGPALLLLFAVAILAAWPAASNRFSLDFPFVVTIVIFLMRFFPVVGQGLGILLRIVADARAGRDVTHLVEVPPSRRRDGSKIGPIQRIQALSLGFWHDPEKLVLRDFNLTLERSQSYAMVGLSGSGKSSFLDLLLGFYPLEEGRLLINGIPIDDIAPAELRARMLLVPQETNIFNDTVANNIRFGANASDETLRQACRIACIDEFISNLPQGYETPLTYRGTNLSGGQKQRIGIARAIVRSPDVLLLDESTSALDADTRARVIENLLREFRERILLFVTHDSYVTSRVARTFDMAKINYAQGSPAAIGEDAQ